MNPTPRLDRLSALLEGLAPVVSVHHAGDAITVTHVPASESDQLHLHLLTAGHIDLELDDGRRFPLDAPAIAVVRADCPHRLVPSGSAGSPGLFCASARFDGPAAGLLLQAFEQPLPLALDESGSELDLIVRLIAQELTQPRCGQPALLARAGEILFIGLLRHLVANPRTPAGLLNGLAEPRIARALVAMHGTPQAPWTLESLALEAGMSRTAFAVRFREAMNHTPGAYLAHLRLSVARRAVRSGRGLKRAAAEAGYASTTALSRALARN